MLTTFAPDENFTFVLNGWFMHTHSQIMKMKIFCLIKYLNEKFFFNAINKDKFYLFFRYAIFYFLKSVRGVSTSC